MPLLSYTLPFNLKYQLAPEAFELVTLIESMLWSWTVSGTSAGSATDRLARWWARKKLVAPKAPSNSRVFHFSDSGRGGVWLDDEYRLVSASLDAGLASPTTCLPLGTPLLRKDVGTGPESADAPWLVFALSLYNLL